MREAVPLREGREVEALRRIERAGGMRKANRVILFTRFFGAGDFWNRAACVGLAGGNFRATG